MQIVFTSQCNFIRTFGCALGDNFKLKTFAMVVSGNSFKGRSKKEYATMKLKAMAPEKNCLE